MGHTPRNTDTVDPVSQLVAQNTELGIETSHSIITGHIPLCCQMSQVKTLPKNQTAQEKNCEH